MLCMFTSVLFRYCFPGDLGTFYVFFGGILCPSESYALRERGARVLDAGGVRVCATWVRKSHVGDVDGILTWTCDVMLVTGDV